jgi:hypothetical protein
MEFIYDNGSDKHGVLRIEDGRVVEILRNDKTYFDEDERETWSTLDEWRESLPPGGKVKRAFQKPAEENPVLVSLYKRLDGVFPYVPIDMYLDNIEPISYSVVDYARKLHSRCVSELEAASVDTTSHQYASRKKKLEAVDDILTTRLEELTADAKAADKYNILSQSRLFTITPDGAIRRVYYSRRLNTVVIHTGSVEPVPALFPFRYEMFEPVTDPEFTLWYMGSDMRSVPVKI